MHLVSLVLIVVFGSATWFLKDPNFIKWKPTVLNWLFAVVFLGSQWIGREPIIQRMMGAQIELPSPIWRRLNLAWTVYFVVIGVINLYVAFNYEESVWVNFKLFGMLGLTIAFVLLQSVFLARHLSPSASPINED
jgi:intracellular septation protein